MFIKCGECVRTLYTFLYGVATAIVTEKMEMEGMVVGVCAWIINSGSSRIVSKNVGIINFHLSGKTWHRSQCSCDGNSFSFIFSPSTEKNYVYTSIVFLCGKGKLGYIFASLVPVNKFLKCYSCHFHCNNVSCLIPLWYLIGWK